MKKIFPLILSLLLVVGTLFFTSCSKADDTPSNADPLPTTATQTFTVNGVTFNMMLVKAGTFTMGATPEQEDPSSDEKPAHQVSLSHDYYMGQAEVTQALWLAVMGNNPSHFTGDNLPVEQVSWDDCQLFIRYLNELTGRRFRLPTEAEWEFAARGGNSSRGYQYAGSNDSSAVAWFDGDRGTHPVMTKQANELGLYDMSGNVFEWCQDGYDDYSSVPQTDPSGPFSASDRVNRGGCWYSTPWGCRVAYRNYSSSDYSDYYLGLRLALSE